jgi:hypothetical protein
MVSFVIACIVVLFEFLERSKNYRLMKVFALVNVSKVTVGSCFE